MYKNNSGFIAKTKVSKYKMRERGAYLLSIFKLIYFTSVIFTLGLFFRIEESPSFWLLPMFALSLFLTLYLFYKSSRKLKNDSNIYVKRIAIGILFNFLGIILSPYTNTTFLDEYVGVGRMVWLDGEDYANTEDPHTVFKKKDKKISKLVEFIWEEGEWDPYEKKFIFWQTAFFTNYTPHDIPYYQGAQSSREKLTLFFTVGPLFVLEVLIRGFLNIWFLMAIPVIALFFNYKIINQNT